MTHEVTRETPLLRKSEEKVLHALADGKHHKFTELNNPELKDSANLSDDSLSEALKRLQKKRMITRDIDSREYVIDTGGLRWLTKKNLANSIIKSEVISEDSSISPPVDSIVAVDVPEMLQSQQVYAPGTPDISKACFKQFLKDTLKAKTDSYQPGDPRTLLPDSGRVVYTASIDIGQVRSWLESADGKEYLKKTLEEMEDASRGK